MSEDSTPARSATGLLSVVIVASLIAAAWVPSPAAASTTAGQLYAFGENAYGELGSTINNGSYEPNPAPKRVALPGSTGPVTQIAAGEGHSLAVTSTGQLYAFGENVYGQLGSATNTRTLEPNPTPALVTLSGATGPVTQVAAGEGFSLAVTSTGQLYAFGENFYGQLGSAIHNRGGQPNPTPTLVTLPGATGPVTQVAAGEGFSLAVTSTGQLYAFGDNQFGQLGSTTNNGTDEPNHTPTLVTLPGATGPVTQVAAGADHSLAVTSTGQLFAFGDNQYGQLGSTTNNRTGEPNPTPTLVTLPGATGPVTQVAAGTDHSLAVTSTGQLYAFGENRYGQLGSTTHANSFEPNPTPALVTLPGLAGAVIQAAAGSEDSLATSSTGQLYAFGENYYGQLGNAINSSTNLPNPTPALVPLPVAGTTLEVLASGPTADHTLVLVEALAVISTSLPTGQVGVAYSASAAAEGGATPYSWSASGLPAGLAIDPASGQIKGTPTSAGGASVTLTVTDANGVSASSAAIPLTIAPAAASETPAGKAAVPAPLTSTLTRTIAPPTLTSVRLSNSRFGVARASTAISAKRTPLGTRFSFRLSAAAKLQIAITQSVGGLRRGHSCLAPSRALERARARRCARTLTLGTLTRAHELKGAGGVAFSGRIGRRALAPGGYRATLIASNAGGRSKPIALSFTIVR